MLSQISHHSATLFSQQLFLGREQEALKSLTEIEDSVNGNLPA